MRSATSFWSCIRRYLCCVDASHGDALAQRRNDRRYGATDVGARPLMLDTMSGVPAGVGVASPLSPFSPPGGGAAMPEPSGTNPVRDFEQLGFEVRTFE